jgi:2',3'-cyclic-nucleotide 2'-phosphodiesterase (5'-nucleotidase family)
LQNYFTSKLIVGKQPSNDVSEGPYPTIIQNNGRDVLVTQAFWAGKYLGFLNVTFNENNSANLNISFNIKIVIINTRLLALLNSFFNMRYM